MERKRKKNRNKRMKVVRKSEMERKTMRKIRRRKNYTNKSMEF